MNLSKDFHKNCRKATGPSESPGPLSGMSVPQNSAGPKSQNTRAIKKCYGPSQGKPPTNMTVNCDDSRQTYGLTSGNVILANAKGTKMAKRKERKPSLSHPHDPIDLFSDDEDSDRANRRESVAPQQAASACCSRAPPTGGLEAACNENTHRGGILAQAELNTSPLAMKASMRDPLGSFGLNKPLKRRKIVSEETVVHPLSLSCQSSCDRVILKCRCVRVGILLRVLLEPVTFALDFIKIKLEEPEGGQVAITLDTSDVMKCDWCQVRNPPVVFLQTTPAVYGKLSTQLQMHKKEKVWTECKEINKIPTLERYIILSFDTDLDLETNTRFEKILIEIGRKNKISNFFSKISFEEANTRIVACRKTYAESIKGSVIQKLNIMKTMAFDSKILLQSKQKLQLVGDDKATGQSQATFTGPVEKLIVYPPPPARGGISVTSVDLHCLKEGVFLNDIIIDFYLKYLVLEKLKKEEANRIHIFSSSFYQCLTDIKRQPFQECTNLSTPKRRHLRVKSWTRYVNIFAKDFIFVPLNENAHWFLAIICFPGFEKPQYEHNPHFHKNALVQKTSTVVDRCISSPTANVMASSSQACSAKSVISRILNIKLHMPLFPSKGAPQEERDPRCGEHTCNVKGSLEKISQTASESEASKKGDSVCEKVVDKNNSEHGPQGDCLRPSQHAHAVSEIKPNCPHESPFKEQESPCSPERGQWHFEPTVCKQPCILLLDSLRGPSRSHVVKILREYLEEEWEIKKGTKRSFSTDVMMDLSPNVPQQSNLSDCGVYLLQYVESFFENPVLNFALPMDLKNWFPPLRIRAKREEIRNLILKMEAEQCNGRTSEQTGFQKKHL